MSREALDAHLKAIRTLNGGQFALYHGSPHGIAVGDTVRPTKDVLYGGPDSAWATRSIDDAASFAGTGATNDPQGRLFSSVYEVEHGDARRVSPGSAVHKSPTGLKVKKHVGFVKVATTSPVEAAFAKPEWL